VRRMSVAIRALVLLTVAAAVAVVPAAIREAGPDLPAAPHNLLIPTSGALFGAFVGVPDPPNQTALELAVTALEADIGRTLAIDHHYHPWNDPFPGPLEQWDLGLGRIPMISWHGSDTEAIVSGSQDALIKARAVGVRNLGEPVFLRWGWEMDGGRNAAWAKSPASYITAWRHLHELFVSQGATNAVWVFCPGAPGFQTGHAQLFYPGSAYVDWVCADGYNWAPIKRGDRWQTFSQIFAPFYSWAVVVGKPMMIGETGALEAAPRAKAMWISDARRTMERQMTSIRAFVYFDHAPTEGGTRYDWRVDSSAPTLRAYWTMANDPYFSAAPP
jgi:hypothetical protein